MLWRFRQRRLTRPPVAAIQSWLCATTFSSVQPGYKTHSLEEIACNADRAGVLPDERFVKIGLFFGLFDDRLHR